MKFNQTFKVEFWLFKKKQKKNGRVPIYARIKIGDNDRSECSVKRDIDPKYWDNGKASDSYLEAPVLNEYLDLVRAEIGKHFNMLLSIQDHVTAEAVKLSYKGLKDKKQKQVKKTFLQGFKSYLKVLEGRVKAKNLSTGRFKKFGVLYGKCESFIPLQFKKSDLPLEEVRLNFIAGFHHHMLTVEGIALNTASKYAKDLKQVMDYIVMAEDLPKNVFQPFKCKTEKVNPRYLTEDELEKIFTKELSIPRLEEVRDCFIFCCYTGYSYSDAAALTHDDVARGIDGSWWILRERGKTYEVENVPLLQIPLELVKKYKKHPYCQVNDKLLPFNSNQRYNGYLKELADICGIKKNLTTHVARHTCGTTVLLANDVPIETAQEILGHKDIHTTKIYARIVQKKLSKDMMKLKKKLAAKQRKPVKYKRKASNTNATEKNI